MALIALAIGIFFYPQMGSGLAAEFPGVSYLPLIALPAYLSLIPFFAALYQAWKLLNYIDKNKAFSELSVKALRAIKYCGVFMTLVLLTAMPLAFSIAQYDDAPGLVLIAMAFFCSPLVVSVFAALLQKLLQSAIDIQSENELTV